MTMERPIRILQIVSFMHRRGLETLLMNCMRRIDRTQVQFDFIVHRPFRADYDDEIEALGGKIHRLPRLNPFDPRYKKALRDFFREHPEYRIVHCHLDCMSALPLAAAREAGVPVRIAHAHSSSQDKDLKYLLKRYYMKKIPAAATHFFACSGEAGSWMFPGQSVRLIRNGIDTAAFAFDPERRAVMRRELELGDALTVGHVGRLIGVKNHDFLLDVFAQLHRSRPDAVLLLVGNGPLEEQLREKAARLGISGHIQFLGVRSDVPELMQAMDVFVLPSLYEGLGISAVEAQAAGLPCLLSENVPWECRMAESAIFLPLEDPALWAQEIQRCAALSRTADCSGIIRAGYDITTTAAELQQFYLEHWHKI
mgnify:CR=1 FL=1